MQKSLSRIESFSNLKRLTVDTLVRTMTTSLNVCDLRTHNHELDEYAIVDFYFDEMNEQENLARAHFRREIHLVDDLKTNVLIENDILDFEKIVINSLIKIVSIKSCNVIILMKIKSRLYESVVKQLVNLRNSIVVSSKSQMLVLVHHDHLLERDFLFELESKCDISLFAHMIDAFLHSIMMRNEKNRVIQL